MQVEEMVAILCVCTAYDPLVTHYVITVEAAPPFHFKFNAVGRGPAGPTEAWRSLFLPPAPGQARAVNGIYLGCCYVTTYLTLKIYAVRVEDSSSW